MPMAVSGFPVGVPPPPPPHRSCASETESNSAILLKYNESRYLRTATNPVLQWQYPKYK